MKTSLSVIFKLRKVSENIVGGNQTHILCDVTFFSKFVTFVR